MAEHIGEFQGAFMEKFVPGKINEHLSNYF
jgi:hypothetical protein